MNFYEQIFSRGRATGEGMTHFERLFAAKFGGPPPPEVREYTGAVPVTITADGTPLIDLLISGNEEHTGTPTPDSPIMPEGCGERTGNLLDLTTLRSIIATVTPIPSGVNLSGKYYARSLMKLEPNKAHTMKWVQETISGTANTAWRIQYTDNTYSSFAANGGTLTPSKETSGVLIYITQSDATASVNFTNIMLNLGSTVLPYEPFGVKIPISSAGQTSNIYLGGVQTTRKIKKLVFDGTENWTYDSVNTRLSTPLQEMDYKGARMTTFMCSHFIVIDDGRTISNVPNNAAYAGGSIAYPICFIKTSDYTSADDFKAYLAAQYAAGTPVTVWYILANPETAVVNEPLMRIGDYADTVSKSQAGVAIPTNNGSTTVDVNTTLKPSEVYIKYMG